MTCPRCGATMREVAFYGSFIGSASLLYHYAQIVAVDTPRHRRPDVRLCDTCKLADPIPPKADTFRGADLEPVTEIGPCPLCGTETVKNDQGGTTCPSCAQLRGEPASSGAGRGPVSQ